MTTKRLLGGASIVILIIFVIATINWIGVQQNTIGNLQAKIFNLKNDLTNTIDEELDSVKEQLIEEMNKQNSNVYNAEYTITDYNKEKNLAYVTIRFSLKKYSKNTPVTLVYSENNVTKNVPAQENNGVFESALSLSMNSTADEPVVYFISYKMGEDIITSGHIIDISPSDDLYERLDSKGCDISFDSNSETTDITVFSYFQNHFNTNEKLKFKSCIMTIYCGSKVVETVDLMNKLEIKSGYQCLSEDSQDYHISIDRPETENIEAKIIAIDGYGFEYNIE